MFPGVGLSKGKLYITNELQRVLAEAETAMKQFNDEYLSVEHILLAAVSLPSEVGKYLKTKGIKPTGIIEDN